MTNPKTAALIQRNVPAQTSQFDSVDISHDVVAIIPHKRDALRIYIINLYSSSKDSGHEFGHLFSLAKQPAHNHMPIIAGDFNARHTALGFSHCTKVVCYGSKYKRTGFSLSQIRRSPLELAIAPKTTPTQTSLSHKIKRCR